MPTGRRDVPENGHSVVESRQQGSNKYQHDDEYYGDGIDNYDGHGHGHDHNEDAAADCHDSGTSSDEELRPDDIPSGISDVEDSYWDVLDDIGPKEVDTCAKENVGREIYLRRIREWIIDS